MAEQDELTQDPSQEIERLRQQVQIQGLVISQYQQALANANHQNAILTAQLKLASQPTA